MTGARWTEVMRAIDRSATPPVYDRAAVIKMGG